MGEIVIQEKDQPSIIAPLTGGKDFQGLPELEPVDNSTGKSPIYHGLTAKQENFCRHVANGMTRSASYRMAYGVQDDPANRQSVYNRAHSLIKRQEIKERIDALLSEREQLAIADYAQIRRFIIERLQIEALRAESDGSRVRALELLGKMDKIQLFSDKPSESEKPMSRRDIAKELEERLTRILSSKGNKEIDAPPSCDSGENVV